MKRAAVCVLATSGLLVGSGLVGATAGAVPGVPDIAVTKDPNPNGGCGALITNIGGATARNVQLVEVWSFRAGDIGDLAPGESLQHSYFDCMPGLPIAVAAAPLNGDSNWLNNAVTVQFLGRGQ